MIFLYILRVCTVHSYTSTLYFNDFCDTDRTQLETSSIPSYIIYIYLSLDIKLLPSSFKNKFHRRHNTQQFNSMAGVFQRDFPKRFSFI